MLCKAEVSCSWCSIAQLGLSYWKCRGYYNGEETKTLVERFEAEMNQKLAVVSAVKINFRLFLDDNDNFGLFESCTPWLTIFHLFFYDGHE